MGDSEKGVWKMAEIDIVYLENICRGWSGNDGIVKSYTYMNKVYTRDLIEGNKSIIYIYINVYNKIIFM